MKEVADHFVTDVKDMTVVSRSGYRYILTFVDRKSRFLKVYLLRKKSDVSDKTKEFLSWVKTQKGKNPKKISSDYGGEYTCYDLQNFCRNLGIDWDFTEADTPQQNGIAERINRTIVEGSSAMRRTAGLPGEFWEDAVTYFVHIKNRTPHKSINKRTPVDVWNGDEEEEAKGVWGFKTFGCEAYKAMGDKGERGKRMVYLGVCDNRKTDKFFDMEKEKVVFGYCCYYDEDCFPLRQQQTRQPLTGTATSLGEVLGASSFGTSSDKVRGGDNESKEETNKLGQEEDVERREWWRLLFDEKDVGEIEEKEEGNTETTTRNSEMLTESQERVEDKQFREEWEGRTTDLPDKESEITWEKGDYEIESVIEKRKSRFGKRRGYDYLVKWKGDWGENSQQWLPQNKLRSAKEAIHKYETARLIDHEDEEPEGLNDKRSETENGRNINMGTLDKGSNTDKGIDVTENSSHSRPGEEEELVNHDRAAAFLAGVTKNKKQLTRKEASQRDDWHCFLKAEGEEIRNSFDTGCVSSVTKADIPKGATILGSMMVYKKKEATALEPERYRSRMCVLGNRQKPDSYSETFAAVAKVKTFRVLLALAVHLGMKMSQLDISNAFMNSKLPEDIYMYPPKGWEHLGILKLNNSLYGLKQAPRLWYDTLTGKLKSLGFIKVDSDVCCFKHPSKRCYVLIYVDDVIIMTKDELMRYNLVEELKLEFKLRNFDSARLYVGLELVWSNEGDKVTVTQTTMAKDLLQVYRHDNAESVSTPEEPKLRLEKDTGKSTRAPYRELVGSLLFLLSTRPDIAGAVRALSQFMQSATNRHWTAAKRVLAYLKGTEEAGICYIRSEKFTIHAYCDSDFAEHRKDRKSVSGYVIYAQGGPLIWKSKKQSVVAQSSAEAEYIALAECIKDLIWLKMLLWELDVKVEVPVVVYVDSAAAKALAENAIDHDRSKHIDVRYHLIRHHVELGWLKIRKVDSAWNVADVLTKPVTDSVFRKLVGKLLNYTRFGYYSVDDR